MPGPKNKNLFFPFTLEELKEIEEEGKDVEEQERHMLTNDWYDTMGGQFYIYWKDPDPKHRKESP